MLSYRHGFHAGNHADVLKHVTLCAILARLTIKEAPLRYIETHAGAGGYDLSAPAAQKNREHESGVAKLWSATDAPAAVTRWLELVRRYNSGPALRRYPGSPWLARQSLRPNDRLFLYELHPAEHRALRDACAEDRRVKVLREDGLVGCVGLVPPPAKRALLFIDPSYERRDEPREVVAAVRKAHERFATGVIAIWYPVIERSAAARFERALRALRMPAISLYELDVVRPRDGTGLLGSGMFIVNPPWQLDDELEQALPWLSARLRQSDGARFRIER